MMNSQATFMKIEYASKAAQPCTVNDADLHICLQVVNLQNLRGWMIARQQHQHHAFDRWTTATFVEKD